MLSVSVYDTSAGVVDMGPIFEKSYDDLRSQIRHKIFRKSGPSTTPLDEDHILQVEACCTVHTL